MNKKTNIAILVVLLAACAGLVLLLPIERYVVEFVGWVQQSGVWGGVVFGMVCAGGVVIFVPSTLISLAAGFLFGPVWGTVVASIAGTIGATLAFLVGRFFAHDWVAEKVDGHPRFKALYRAIDNEGFKTVVLARLVPVFPFALVNYGFSTTRVPTWKYILGSWLGEIPATIVYVYLGSFAGSLARLLSGDVEESPLQDSLFIVGGIAAILVAVLVTRQAKKELEKVTSEAADEGAAQAPSDSQPSSHGASVGEATPR